MFSVDSLMQVPQSIHSWGRNCWSNRGRVQQASSKTPSTWRASTLVRGQKSWLRAEAGSTTVTCTPLPAPVCPDARPPVRKTALFVPTPIDNLHCHLPEPHRGHRSRGVEDSVKARQECSETDEEVVALLLVVLDDAIMLRALRHPWRPRKTLLHTYLARGSGVCPAASSRHTWFAAPRCLDSWLLDDGCGAKVTSSLRFLAGVVDLACVLLTMAPHLAAYF